MLQASGVSLALPWLESMTPAFASSAEAAPPKRMIFMCTALGLHSPNLWPEADGKDYESTPYLDLLKPHRENYTLISGLQHEDQTGRQPHDSEMTFLTAARKPGMGGFRNSISVDQVAASLVGDSTRYRSITLGTMKAQSQSYTSGGVMIPAEISPARMFSKLFLQGTPQEVERQKHALSVGKSILDELGTQAKSLRKKASAEDNHLLADYFDSVRAAERNLSTAEAWMQKPKPQVDADQPQDVSDNADIIGRANLLMQLVPLIVQTDSTRVISVMIQDHYAVPKVEGVSGNHHNLSHHGQDSSKIEQLEKIESGIVSCFGSLLEGLKSKTEASSNLLANTSVLFGSNLGNANAHHARNLPIILAGGNSNHGRFVKKKEGTPLCNLFVRMLNDSGFQTDTFGQSTGSLDW